MLYPVIMAGGSGTRLWPLSRQAYPKQFLSLTGGETTMLQQTIDRLDSLDHEAPIVVCNEDHRFIAGEQLRQQGVNHNGIILEPCGRNTAPAICLAAFQALEKDENASLLVLSADHAIQNAEAFQEAIGLAKRNIQSGQLLTFGVVPTEPATGYGYINAQDLTMGELNKVHQFVEKPSLDIATQYVESGDYLWNSGMFLFSAQDYLNELEQSRPDILKACQKAWDGKSLDMEFVRVDEESFSACPSESIDYAVMEVTEQAYVVALDAGWSDLGSWASLAEISQSDAKGNVCIGDVINLDSNNNYIHAGDKLVAVLGVDDVVVVNTKDAVLVTTKENSQNVKSIVNVIKEAGRNEHEHHREVYRPWGMKRITVKPGAKLSVQKHHHRAEHWVVVSGMAQVRVDDEEKLLSENESVFIPVGAIHSLENPGKIPLELIEVQSFIKA